MCPLGKALVFLVRSADSIASMTTLNLPARSSLTMMLPRRSPQTAALCDNPPDRWRRSRLYFFSRKDTFPMKNRIGKYPQPFFEYISVSSFVPGLLFSCSFTPRHAHVSSRQVKRGRGILLGRWSGGSFFHLFYSFPPLFPFSTPPLAKQTTY